MKKFAFRLNSVLRLKEQMVRQSQRRLVAIAEQQRACDEQIESLREELRRDPPNSTALQAADWAAHASYARLIEQRLRDSQRLQSVLREQWLAERAVYQQSDQEAESIRNLKTKQLGEHAYELARQEAADIEEYVLRDWMQDGEIKS